MKIAIISDIHSNIEALSAVLNEIENHNIRTIYCLGDIVGYGPNPRECIDTVKKTSQVILAGNHDFASVKKTELEYFNSYAREAIEKTRRLLKNSHRDFLSSLDYTLEDDTATYVHATPELPSMWDYILSSYDAVRNFTAFTTQVCFVGHSHIPVIFETSDNDSIAELHSQQIELHEDYRYIINVGSVGQPRDQDARAAFGIYEADHHSYEQIRVEYDVAKTQKKMRKLKLPEFLITRIAEGQ